MLYVLNALMRYKRAVRLGDNRGNLDRIPMVC